MLKKIFLLILSAAFMALISALAAVAWLVVLNPGAQIQQVNIDRILAVESPVYYRDGRDKIGVFFEKAHRRYVPYARIPKNFINAIIAAEDHDFFTHHGVDFLGLLRALAADIRAGRIVQGGSTITQQAAKNLFKRKGRSIGSKLKELLFALRLEYHYPKEKILEFYANQFYVSGNGRGLGVAAGYYFNKDVKDLDLLECAFIAGSVKRPNYYNPFFARDAAVRTKAARRAKLRTAYVLDQMYQLGMISAKQYQRLRGREIPFSKGRTSYAMTTAMDMVKEALNSPEVEEALSRHGIDNIATSGIRIITTLEKSLQESSLFALRKELSRLSIRMQGYNREELQKAYAEIKPSGGSAAIRINDFRLGRITAVISGNNPSVLVSLGTGPDHTENVGRIDRSGLMNTLVPMIKYLRQRWSEADEQDMPLLLDRLRKDDLVYVSVRGRDPASGEYRLDLEEYPVIQGGVMALRDGTIRAMAGGVENRFFNRAVYAKRAMGSIFKPLVYCAALQLGWNILDTLDNRRNVFVFQNRPYFPRPDHESPYKKISMTWAGARSENVATVWLLYHLCDRLSPARFKEMISHLDVGRRQGESLGHYIKRIRDKNGILINRKALFRAAFEAAVDEIEPDLAFAGKTDEADILHTFQYDAEFDILPEDIGTGDGENSDREDRVRQDILNRNFLRFKKLREGLRDLAAGTAAYAGPNPTAGLYHDWRSGRYVYGAAQSADENWQRIDGSRLAEILAPLNNAQRNEFWDTVLIDGILTPGTFDLLDKAVGKEFRRLSDLRPYSSELLYYIRDFRVLAGLEYLIGLCRTLGIESRLEPVLSFPLGSNVVSLLEIARAYQGLVTGRTGRTDHNDALAIIERIENSDGETIYRNEQRLVRPVDPKVSLEVNNILQNVIKHGTGRHAYDNITLHSPDPEREKRLTELDLGLPVLGKTGTANRFTNSAFAGFVPEKAARANALSLNAGYALSVYVGYDDNRPMVRTSTHITGSSGALPLWTRIANDIFFKKNYAARMDLADLSFSGLAEVPLKYPDLGQIQVTVKTTDGLIIREGEGGTGAPAAGKEKIYTFGTLKKNGDFKAARFFRPYWLNGMVEN